MSQVAGGITIKKRRRPATIVTRMLAETGELFALAVEGLRRTWDIKTWWRDYVEQCLFIIKVTAGPVMLIAVPLGATVALQVGQLTRQLGAASLTGSAVMLGIVQQAAPLAAALLIAGAGGSAMASDMGARHIRDELAAMEVISVHPVHRLVTPRLWASATVAVMLVSLVIVAGVAGGYYFNVRVQGVTPGAYFAGATTLLVLSDLLVGLFKAVIFGFIAAMVACYKGMNCKKGPVGVGRAVNEAVVLSFLLIFAVEVVVTGIYFVLVPPKI
jgi:phospholipid/cholesterol/gamma-HCH transport system permease protein